MSNPAVACGLALAIALGGCAAAERTPDRQRTPEPQRTPATQSYRGWYMEHGAQGSFQPCGQSAQWQVGASADLAVRAKAFGLQPDTPVYVRLSGAERDGTLDVSSVDQFGSAEPVRDCALDGVVVPQP